MPEPGPNSADSSYYAILNVAREASEEDIRRSYRYLATIYHPDKHTDPGSQEAAVFNFTRLQEAYEVCLSDCKNT